MTFHKTSSKIVLKGGLGAGIGAQLPKGNTLKATTVVFSNEVCSTFTVMTSRTLLSDHVVLYAPVNAITCLHLSDKIKNGRSYTSTFPYAFKSLCLIK